MFKFYSNILLICLLIISFSCQKNPDQPKNQVPVADAGTSQSILLSDNSATLSGSGTDADGKIVGYLWSQLEGPSPSTIANPASPITLVKNFAVGKYIFQLMVTDDKGAVGVDTVSVLVSPPAIQTLTLQPQNNPYEYQIINLNGKDASGQNTEIPIFAWTKDGNPYTLREVLKFDLSTIPSNATIKSANLYLYSAPTSMNGNLTDANYGTDNSLSLQQVTTDWNGNSIGWFNQPSTTTVNQIIIPTTTKSMLDLNLDIAAMIQSMVSNNKNYGFLLRLQNETIYTSRIFVSSSSTLYPDKRPKLVVVFQ
jgi:hypothetical protein